MREIETKAVETAAFRDVVQRRLEGPKISAAEMVTRIESMIERKRRLFGLPKKHPAGC